MFDLIYVHRREWCSTVLQIHRQKERKKKKDDQIGLVICGCMHTRRWGDAGSGGGEAWKVGPILDIFK